ncbi:MAG: hypothetical protein R3E93_05790 [Thiothrix sp.]
MTITDLDTSTPPWPTLTGGGHGILDNADIDVKWMDKGMHGYETSASLLVWRDNDYLTVGHIAYVETGRNRGGLLEPTGTGCKVLQLEHPALWLELFNLLQYHDWRIPRGRGARPVREYVAEHGYTVPKLLEQAVNAGLFQSDRLRNPNMKQSFSMGDWSALAVGNLTPATYIH